jgi:hypothetical protein
MSLSKKAQWIVWQGRKDGADAEAIVSRCEEKGVTDSREDLLKAITSRPYQPQPQRTRTYTAQQVSPAEALMQKVAALGLTSEEAEPILAILKQKQAEAKAAAKAKLLADLLAAAQAL